MKKKQSTFRFLYVETCEVKWKIVILSLVQIILGISSVFYALVLRDIINAACEGNGRFFFRGMLQMVGLVCLQLLLRAVTRYMEEKTRTIMENHLKKKLFSTLLGKDFASVTSVHSGEWMNRLTSDTMVVANGITEILPGLSGMSVKMIGAIIMIVVLEPRFCYLLVPGGVGMVVLSYMFRKIMKKLHKNVQEQDGRLRVFLQEMLESILVIRTFATEDYVIEEAEKKMEEHKNARMRKNHFSNLCNVGFGIMINGAYVLGVFFCGYGILNRTMTYGTFWAVLQLIGQLQTPFANISGFLPKYYAMTASAERIMEAEYLLERESGEIYSLERIQDLYRTCFRGIQVNEASFTYFPRGTWGQEVNSKEEMSVIWRGINLEICKGEYVAFIGKSGCGKSTLLKLLMCLYPLEQGQRYVLMNEERECLTTCWQKLFAYVPQGNYLMSGTIREIVTFSNQKEKWDDKRIQKSLKIACALEFVKELEQGVDTMLGERGFGLSEGQMQRLAIARAVFSGHPILLLDECTSALDEVTEKKVLQNLRSMTDKTVLIVTHRSTVVEICDSVYEIKVNGCERKKR